MNTMQQRHIRYHFYQHSWSLTTKTRQNPPQTRSIYWGADQVPLRIVIEPKSRFTTKQATLDLSAYIHFGKSNKPVLGPLIGILTTENNQGRFMGVKSNFIDIMRTGRRVGGIVFIFTPNQVDWEQRQVEGAMYDPAQKKWIKANFPLPNVVYNRIPARKVEKLPYVQQCLQQLQNVPHLTLFNPHFFDKDDLYQKLSFSPELAQHLPLTVRLSSKQHFKTMLRQSRFLYLKPVHGKAGAGIMSVRWNGPHTRHPFELSIQQHKQRKTWKTKHFEKLWSWISKQSQRTSYIMQNGINLAHYNECPFDFRTLVQKGKHGSWKVTGIGIRVAGRNRITTHVPQGGSIEQPEHVLKHIVSESETKQILDQVHHLALAIAQHLEEHYGHLGEMSMDLGMDNKQHIWFFEANAKPMKFDEPDIRRKSLENLIHYAQYLTFNKGDQHHALDQAN